MGDVDELDDQHILMQARELKNGVWIERILVQMRRSLCGMGVETFKDVPDKVIQALPNLTGPASHPTWEQQVFKIACLVKDGAQLPHCTHAMSFIEDNIPLPPEFKTLGKQKFQLSTATTEQLELRASFTHMWRAFQESGQVDMRQLDTEALTPDKTEDSEETSEEPYGKNTEVEADLAMGKGGTTKWVEGQIVDHFTDTSGHLGYIVYLPRDDKGKLLHSSRKFTPEYVRRIYEPPQTGKSIKFADGSPVKGTAVGFLASAKNAIEHGYDVTWPIGIVIWNLHQCTKAAQDLATAMYSTVLQTISDVKLREDVSQGIQGNLITLLLALRRRFGSNAGVLHIQRAASFGTLKPFTESTELAHELRQFLKYHEETNIFVYQFNGV